jgi:CHAT domain-containing protein
LAGGGCRQPRANTTQQDYEACELKLNRGELKEALEEVDSALKHFPAPDNEWHFRFTLLKAEILVRQRLSKEALALLEPELPASLRNSDLGVWRKLTQGTAHIFLLQFDDAAQLLREAEELAGSYAPQLNGEVALRKGTLAFQRADWETARLEYHRALTASLAGGDRFLEAAALGSLGLVAVRQEHFDESIEWNTAALELSKAQGAQTSAARILGNLGWSYFEMGNYDESLALFEQAEESLARLGARGSQIKWLTNVGIAQYYLRSFDKAEQDTQQALQLAKALGENVAVAECLNSLSSIALAKSRIDLATSYNAEAHRISRNIGDVAEETTATLISGRIDEFQNRYREAEQCFRSVLTDATAATSIRWEAQARLAKVYDKEGRTAEAEREYRKAIQTIQSARHSVGQDELRLTFLSSAIDFYNDYIGFLVQHGRFEEALRVADRTRSQTLAEGLTSSSKVQEQFSPGLPPRQLARDLHATLLLYWLGQDQSYLWAITPTKITCVGLPKEPQIEPMVKSYREQLLSGKDVLASGSAEGRELYQMLIAPADKLFVRNRRVIVLPAEGLYGLNFETLIVPEPAPHFWIEDVTISEANSLALLSTARQRANSQEKSLLLVGNPDTPDPDFPPLLQAAAEIQKVSTHFPEARRKVLEGKQATPSAYLHSNPSQFSYLHFVTHGTASHTRPLESAVILTKEGDSYKLYARDIVTHPLKADLVTISACNGAGTRTYAGEGLVGLSWAFLRAGAHNVIASLWEVSDASSTAQLMDALYTNLNRGADPATALREAKLFILKSNSNTVFRKPFYWAPFQLYAGS